ncbi:hypothetical protein [Aeromonas phage 85AhydR10PP]|nr:hypothetical protein [Aeromonas phage 85AhydR10PP]
MKSLIATCLTTGTITRFQSITEAEMEGYSADCIGHCLAARARQHAGHAWEEEGKGKPVPRPSPKMEEVAAYRNNGLRNKQIAALMGIKEKTVRVYAGRCIQAGLIESHAVKGNWND